MSHAPEQLRVAIREIREYAYRALVVAGASPGEAATAADQVLHAELHTGDGVARLAAVLSAEAWPDCVLTVQRRGGVLDLDCGRTPGELRLSAAATDLIAGEGPGARVRIVGDVPLTSLWDGALLAAATALGSDVWAVGPAGPAGRAVRLATADAELLTGQLPAGEDDIHLVIATGGPVPADGLVVGTRSTVDERAARRRRAAQAGVTVDPAAWSVVAECARRFLVPER